MVPVYPEDLTDADNYNVDFFPAFIGCTMGQDGSQMSTYEGRDKMGRRPEECGFKVTKAIKKDTAEMPKDVIPNPAIMCATKEG